MAVRQRTFIQVSVQTQHNCQGQLSFHPPLISSADVLVVIAVNVSILHVLPHIHQKQFDLLPRPAQSAGEKHHRQALDARCHINRFKSPYPLQSGIFRPGTDGEFEDVLLDVNKTDVFHPLLQMARRAGICAEYYA